MTERPAWLAETLAKHTASSRRRLAARDPRPGDVWIAERPGVRMAIVVIEAGEALVSCVAADADTETLTDTDVVLEPAEIGLPYGLVARFGLVGPVVRAALVERIGRVPFAPSTLRRTANGAALAGRPFARRTVGLPLRGPDDPRWADQERRLEEFSALWVAHPSDAYRRVLAAPAPACDACGGALEHSRETLYNEALLTIGGGYGSFVDDLGRGGPYAYVICEACAKRVCETLGLRDPLAEHATSTVCACS